jgi:RNA 3'-terminal phosphate cyclase
MTRRLILDCSVGEGGGSALRLALPMAVAREIPLTLLNLRGGRSAATRGVGWTHAAFIEAVSRWTDSSADFRMGGTTVHFTPGRRPDGALRIDLDDPARTFATDSVAVERDYDGASDHFVTNADNVDGRGVRGHAVSMFLLGLLPLLAIAEDSASIEVIGGTETPGGPFVDAVTDILFPLANSRLGTDVVADVSARGLMGRGGGYVTAKRLGRESRPGGLVARVYIFGDSAHREASESAAVEHLMAIQRRLSRPEFSVELMHVPYGRNQTQVLFLLGNSDGFQRDVSICAEEGLIWRDLPILTRLQREMTASSGRTSRFIGEQLLPVAVAMGRPLEFVTERTTAHLEAFWRCYGH